MFSPLHTHTHIIFLGIFVCSFVLSFGKFVVCVLCFGDFPFFVVGVFCEKIQKWVN